MFQGDDPLAMPLGDLPNEAAIFINLGSIALCAIQDAAIKLGDSVVVFGGGIVGQLAVQMALLDGARRVFLVEPLQSRRELATAVSEAIALDPKQTDVNAAILEQNEGRAPDVVIECSGSVAGLQGAIRVAGVAGVVVAAGMYAGGAGALCLGEEFLHNRVTLKASMSVWGCPSRSDERWDRVRLLQQSLYLLSTRKLNVSRFLSATFPFDQAQSAYQAVHREPEKYLKVAFTY
jgi:threonine dehydrogenase-like Zn-dependent dehydrogenase